MGVTPPVAASHDGNGVDLDEEAGAEDTRTREQRYHDALQEAMR